jgi:hypothetical protein
MRGRSNQPPLGENEKNVHAGSSSLVATLLDNLSGSGPLNAGHNDGRNVSPKKDYFRERRETARGMQLNEVPGAMT